MPTYRPVHGTHRAPDPHRAWCRNLFDSLSDGGTWGVPRSLLTFHKRGNQLVLVERGKYHSPRDQQGDYELIRKRFASAGIEVIDESTPPTT